MENLKARKIFKEEPIILFIIFLSSFLAGYILREKIEAIFGVILYMGFLSIILKKKGNYSFSKENIFKGLVTSIIVIIFLIYLFDIKINLF